MFDTTSLFLREKSFENYSDAAVLEFYLSSAGVRGDSEQIIRNLFKTFGSYKNILEARPEQLQAVPGVTRKVCTMISMIMPLARFVERINADVPKQIANRRDAEAVCKSLLLGERLEHFYVLCLNAQCRLNGYRLVSTGSISEVSAYPRIVVEAALNLNAHSVILCHNHPGGSCAPSREDIASTLQLRKALSTVDILTLDHIIVAGSSCYSMAQHGDLEFGRS